MMNNVPAKRIARLESDIRELTADARRRGASDALIAWLNSVRTLELILWRRAYPSV